MHAAKQYPCEPSVEMVGGVLGGGWWVVGVSDKHCTVEFKLGARGPDEGVTRL